MQLPDPTVRAKVDDGHRLVLVENHFLDDSHAHLSVACFAIRDEQTPLRGKQSPSASTRTGLSDDVSSFMTVASRALEMVSSGRSLMVKSLVGSPNTHKPPADSKI